METKLNKNTTNIATAIHVSTFLKYLFPFGNFIGPLVLWVVNKDKLFVDHHGRSAINFQLSILIYSLVIGIICIPFGVIFASDFVSLIDTLEHNLHTSTNDIKNLSGFVLLIAIAALVLFALFIFELYCVINATIKASKGEYYSYPFSIQFLAKEETTSETNELDKELEEEEKINHNQSK